MNEPVDDEEWLLAIETLSPEEVYDTFATPLLLHEIAPSPQEECEPPPPPLESVSRTWTLSDTARARLQSMR
tara:strand:+ start:379 stop:594 length:216 start_codon:yes stop_codon:yes gene_type:complete